MLLPVPCVSVICAAAWNPCVPMGRRRTKKSYGNIFLFAVGAALGGHMIGYIGARTIWISCIILLISFLCMFIKEEKKEHPEIVQEEREIRENLQNIRKEAKDVEHILEDDIRSQIEKKK